MRESPYPAGLSRSNQQQPGQLTFSFVVFLFLVASFYLQIGYRWPVFGAVRHELWIALVLGPIAIIRMVKESGWRDSTIIQWSVALILWMVVMVAASDYPGESWSVVRDRVLKMAGLGLIIAGFVNHPRLLILFVGIYLLSFLKITQEGITGLITGSMVWENQGVPRLHGSTPNYHHPNSLAGTQLSVLPFILCLIPTVKGLLKKALIAQAALTIIVIVICGSRTAYLAGLICLLMMLIKSGTVKQKFSLMLIVPILALAFIPDAYWSRFETIFTQEEIQGRSFETRVQILRDAIGTFVENPGGIGVGAFPAYRMFNYGRVQDTHNLYLQVATNLGVVGLVIFFGFILAIYRSLKRMSIRLRDLTVENIEQQGTLEYSYLRILRAICNATIWFLIIRLLLGLFGHDLYEIYWWFAAGIAIAIATCTHRIQRMMPTKK